MSLHPETTVTLNNGVRMPVLGLGVYQSPVGKVTEEAVSTALECGYRHIDTAKVYGNERDVGNALRRAGIPREQVFLTTKLWNGDQGYDSSLRACEESLKQLGVDYVDLYLIHWPLPEKRAESWKALVRLCEEKKCRAIGVSNYLSRHLEELLTNSPVVPAVNQIEFNPFLYQKELLQFCRARAIQVEAYAPLTQAKRLRHPAVLNAAKTHGKTGAQVLLRWGLQHGLVVIPKSVDPERILENSRIFDFELTPDEMKHLDSLNENFHTCWDPADVA